MPTSPQSLLTHIALPVRSLDATLAFYEKFTTLVKIHERHDPETNLRTAWLANERDTTDAAIARFVIVLIEGKLPTAITGDIQEEYGFLTSISHLGLSCATRAEIDLIAHSVAEPAHRLDGVAHLVGMGLEIGHVAWFIQKGRQVSYRRERHLLGPDAALDQFFFGSAENVIVHAGLVAALAAQQLVAGHV